MDRKGFGNAGVIAKALAVSAIFALCYFALTPHDKGFCASSPAGSIVSLLSC